MPAMLEDPTSPAIYRTSGAPPYPTPLAPQIPPTIVPRQVTLRDRITIASLLPFSTATEVPPRLLAYLCQQLNLEIEKGDTYPMITPLPLSAFGAYWFQNFGAVMLLGEVRDVEAVGQMEAEGARWEEVCLGSFYVKPNYPGRSSHVCNGGFLVTEAARNRGVGRLMGEGYLEWAPKLGYTYSVFNLVYETNLASCRIWDALGFKRIGRVKACGNLRSHPSDLVDAIIYGRDLGPEGEDYVSEERFEKIRFYLKHGKYPNGADRAEKSRLRSAATHYKLLPAEDGDEREGSKRLMLKDKEVVSDPQRQYEIARQVHAGQHGGINKTTATIAEQYHWVRIKETVSLVIKNCPDCKESAGKAPTVRPLGAGPDEAYSTAAAPTRKRSPNSGDSLMIEQLMDFNTDAPPSPSQTSESRSQDLTATHRPPIANMHTYTSYMPLDPQIMHIQPSHNQQQQQQRQQQHDGFEQLHHMTNYTEHPTSTDTGKDEAFGMDVETLAYQHQSDTRMATERHIREGDEPMAYQNRRGADFEER